LFGGGGRDALVGRTATRAADDLGQTSDVRYPQFVILVAAVADLAFTGAVAVHVAFYDVVGWVVALVVASALLFVAATITALAAKQKRVVVAAVILVAVAGLGAVGAAVDGGLRYHALRRHAVDADGVHERRVAGAMLSSVSASLASITALPLAGYLAYGVARTDRMP
jgi:hypothetical protein